MIYAPIDVWVSFTPLSVSNGCRLAQGDTHKVVYLTHFVRWWCSGDESTLLVSILGVCWQEWMWKAGIFRFLSELSVCFLGGGICVQIFSLKEHFQYEQRLITSQRSLSFISCWLYLAGTGAQPVLHWTCTLSCYEICYATAGLSHWTRNPVFRWIFSVCVSGLLILVALDVCPVSQWRRRQAGHFLSFLF